MQGDGEQQDGRFHGFDVVALRWQRHQITWKEIDLGVTGMDPDATSHAEQ